jgi:hypothetical protein
MSKTFAAVQKFAKRRNLEISQNNPENLASLGHILPQKILFKSMANFHFVARMQNLAIKQCSTHISKMAC